MPFEWTTYHWAIFSSPRRFLAVSLVVVGMSLVELNAFFLKYVLYVPPESNLNIVRLLVWATLSVPAIREWYSFITDSHTKRLGANLWLAFVAAGVELAIIVRCALIEPDVFRPQPLPLSVAVGWPVALLLTAVWVMMRFKPQWVGLAPSSQLWQPAMKVVLAGIAASLLWIIIDQDVGRGTAPPSV